jgi:hypothetical protein
MRNERKYADEMMRMFRVDAEWERQRRFGRRVCLVLAMAAIIYGYFVGRACTQVPECTAAMVKYDGYLIP